MLSKSISTLRSAQLNPLFKIAVRNYGAHALVNSEKIIDLRSDTVTRPSQEMREAMAKAPVGDDCYHDDPTVNKLESELAKLFGKK